ncbi:MAG: hypothetical protein QM572_03075 [Nocardioides sp.]|uniref:hypothetical protein n=1 Tax=Nocardioides sp. TaxID=35761 RepID=UPI0039E568D5
MRGGRLSVAGVGVVAAGLMLAACGGSDDKPAPTSSASASATAIPAGYPSAAPTGLAYSEPGSELEVGTSAIVAWQPAQSTEVSALNVRVTAIRATTFAESFQDWKVSDDLKTSVPYFVEASIANVSDADLGGLLVPLYGETSADTLLEPSTFASAFKPCNPANFPKPFARGAIAQVCLVYLVPDGGQLTGVTFRPTEEFLPIIWKTPEETASPSPTSSATGSTSSSATASATNSASSSASATITP